MTWCREERQRSLDWINVSTSTETETEWLAWASYQICQIAGCACTGNTGNVFPRRRLQRKPLVSDPDMHHGTCMTHVPWCMSGSLTRGGGETFSACPAHAHLQFYVSVKRLMIYGMYITWPALWLTSVVESLCFIMQHRPKLQPAYPTLPLPLPGCCAALLLWDITSRQIFITP